MIMAAYKGHTEVASLLIERGASMDIQSKDGESDDMIIHNYMNITILMNIYTFL